ncbi:hypothetical protein [Seonamhaeicola sp.]|uniref:hypothetical protein n=1 Tax=Seonamhaeicola sp. TaxID=1912245 RepID=UPI00260A9E8C|nr:hypothetical protein [Seonamhaeicola sp.]
MSELKIFVQGLGKKEKKKAVKKLKSLGIITTDKVKNSCCKKFKKGEKKRCKKCPCYDLLKKVA